MTEDVTQAVCVRDNPDCPPCPKWRRGRLPWTPGLCLIIHHVGNFRFRPSLFPQLVVLLEPAKIVARSFMFTQPRTVLRIRVVDVSKTLALPDGHYPGMCQRAFNRWSQWLEGLRKCLASACDRPGCWSSAATVPSVVSIIGSPAACSANHLPGLRLCRALFERSSLLHLFLAEAFLLLQLQPDPEAALAALSGRGMPFSPGSVAEAVVHELRPSGATLHLLGRLQAHLQSTNLNWQRLRT